MIPSEAQRVDGRNPGLPLARGQQLSCYVRVFHRGEGERFLHAHDDEAAWLVLEGRAVFYDAHGARMADVSAMEGIFLAQGCAYQFECNADRNLLIRVAARLVADG